MDGGYKCRAVAERLNGKEEISKQFIKYIVEEEMRTRSHNSINGHNASPPTQNFPLKKVRLISTLGLKDVLIITIPLKKI